MENSIKYLGVRFYRGGPHQAVDKMEMATDIRYPFINRRSKLNLKNKLLIFKTYLLPRLLYASNVLDQTAFSNLELVNRSQNTF